MKKQMKRIIALICTLALAVTGITFTPTAVNADDEWIHCSSEATNAEIVYDDDDPDHEYGHIPYDHSSWTFLSAKSGGANGNMDYCQISETPNPNYYSRYKFRKRYSGVGSDGKPLPLSYGWDIAQLNNFAKDANLQSGKTYKGTMVIHSSKATEVGTTGATEDEKKCKLGITIFGNDITTTLEAGDNTINFSDVTYDNKKKTILFNLVQLPQYGEITIKSISMQEDTDAFISVPTNTNFVPSKDGVNSPLTLIAQKNGSTTHGNMGYKFDGTPSTLGNTLVKVFSPAHESESEVDPYRPDQWWWWNEAKLAGYMKNVSHLVDEKTYIGTIKVDYTAMNSGYSPKLRTVCGEEVNVTALQDGVNTITIGGTDGFDYNESKPNIEFNLDALETNSVFRVISVSFEEQDPDWTGVPRSQDYAVSGTPWTLRANFVDDPDEGSYGKMKYKVDTEAGAEKVSSTQIKVINPAHEPEDEVNPKDPSEWWWWNSASLKKYMKNTAHLVNGKSYTATIKVDYTAKDSGYTPKLRTVCGEEVDVTTLHDGENTITIGAEGGFDYLEAKSDIQFNLDALEKNSVFKVTSINFVEQYPDWIAVPSNEDYSVSGTLWTLRANFNDDENAGSYGKMKYKVDADAGAAKLGSTQMLLKSTVGVQETYPKDYPDVEKRGKPVEAKDRWWWVSASLKNYATKAGLLPYLKYTGTIKINSTKATDENCHLFVYVDGTEYAMPLSVGENTLNIPQFEFNGNTATGGSQDIKFLFDELPANTVVSISSVEFTEVQEGGWITVPNADSDFTVGPWNMFGNFDPEHEGNWGIVQYKATANPQSYSDYTFKAKSVSGWLAYASFVRLRDYCEDYLDHGDPYNVTIKINSSKATAVNPEDPEALHQLVIVVGRDLFYRDLQEGENTLTLSGEDFQPGTADEAEQIMLVMDGLQQNTEITVTDVEISGPNDGWTDVRNKKWDTVGDWALTARFDKDAKEWSKLAYKAHAGGSGLSAYDFKARRVSGEHTKLASMASLNSYLETAKDSLGNPLHNGDAYNVTVKLSTSGLADSETNYGKLWAEINGTSFGFNVQKGTKTYDLRALTGQSLIYDSDSSQDIDFELDELIEKSIINISEIKIIPLSQPGNDVPNGQALRIEGSPWVLYAITDSSHSQYGALKYSITGEPSELSSLLINVKGVSGWFGHNSVFATLTDYITGLRNGKIYKFTIKADIDETNADAPKPGETKALRIKLNEKDFDFNLPATISGTQTFEREFVYEASKNNDIVFQFDQLLRGTDFNVRSIKIEEVQTPTTSKQTPTQPGPTDVTSSVDPSSGETGNVTTSKQGSKVKAPGKAKIKKIYKKKKSAKKLKLKIKKIKRAKGYQVAIFKTKKKAKKAKNAKKALVKKFVKFKKKITIKSKKLKKKKKLYVRVRAYVLDANGKKVFGKWSKIKKVKFKKKKRRW